jgi:hypothetical protein
MVELTVLGDALRAISVLYWLLALGVLDARPLESEGA